MIFQLFCNIRNHLVCFMYVLDAILQFSQQWFYRAKKGENEWMIDYKRVSCKKCVYCFCLLLPTKITSRRRWHIESRIFFILESNLGSDKESYI